MAFDDRFDNRKDLDLSITDLKSAVDMLERAQRAQVRFTGELVIGQGTAKEHRLTVRWTADQREGDLPIVTSIRRV